MGESLLEGLGRSHTEWVGGLEDQVWRREESKGSLEAEIVGQIPQPLLLVVLDYCFSCWSDDTHSTLILWRFSALVCIRLDPNLTLFAWLLGLGWKDSVAILASEVEN